MNTILITGLSIIAALLGLIYKGQNQKIDKCQSKELCEQITGAMRTEIRLGYEKLESVMKIEMAHIKEILNNR